MAQKPRTILRVHCIRLMDFPPAHEAEGSLTSKTGDLATWMTAGALVVDRRMAPMLIKTGGFQVNPDEIEATWSRL